MGEIDSLDRPRNADRRSAIAWFVTPHGLGHAARASAIIAACARRRPTLRHHLFTTVAPSFFTDALPGIDLVIHAETCDVGMVQRTPFVEDVAATVEAIERLPLEPGSELDRLVDATRATGCRVVVADIAPLGLVVADRLGLPSVLVANFTWDWVYRSYDDDRMSAIADALTPIFRSATLTIATEPCCPDLSASRRVPPISRAARRGRSEVRDQIGIADDQPVVLASLSGLDRMELDRRDLPLPPDVVAVVPHCRADIEAHDGLIRTPAVAGPFHPDLVAASDLVIGKLGYSTVAEVWHAGAALAYLTRPRFPESPVLEAFVSEQIASAALAEDWLDNPRTAAIVSQLLEMRRRVGARPNGADEAARLIVELAVG